MSAPAAAVVLPLGDVSTVVRLEMISGPDGQAEILTVGFLPEPPHSTEGPLRALHLPWDAREDLRRSLKLLGDLERRVAAPSPYPCPDCGAPIVPNGPLTPCEVRDYEGDLP